MCEKLQQNLSYFKEKDSTESASTILEVDIVTGEADEVIASVDSINSTIFRPPRQWSREDLSTLAKALSKYPGGTRQRWVLISNLMNDRIRPEVLFTPEECTKGANMAMEHISKVREVRTVDPLKQIRNSNSSSHNNSSGGAIGQNVADTHGPVILEAGDRLSENLEWTQAQQTALELSLVKHPNNVDIEPALRWEAIAEGVPFKSASECRARYKLLCRQLKAKNKG